MILFKYTKEDTLNYYLTDRTIRFTTISELNDPFESGITNSVDRLRRDFGYFIPPHKEPYDHIHFPCSLLHEHVGWRDFATESQAHSKSSEDNLKLINIRNEILSLRNKIGILSLTEDPLNIAMWTHYGNNHKGFCFEFDTKYITREMETVSIKEMKKIKYFGTGTHKVVYSSLFPNSHTGMDISWHVRSAFLTKSETWQYEKEHRMIIDLDLCNSLTKAGGLLHLPKEAIRAVYLGCNASEPWRNEALKLCSENGIIAKSVKLRKDMYELFVDCE